MKDVTLALANFVTLCRGNDKKIIDHQKIRKKKAIIYKSLISNPYAIDSTNQTISFAND